ncbi:hypothetical protein [Rhizobium sp. Leaf383]|uniref:hypothetical protein n=1 Tax=Rhizobium sp. Leaf383 TaxID=1736357 RepID=UPI00071384C1|nr:hypothetical protein [Rhizobium sp. Leaf383]KQS84258.1 hypothetical protein ASG58_21040 [Rhizobium sp. Leaf383]
MVSLKTAGLRFNSTMFRSDNMPFEGTVEQDAEGKLIGYDFSAPRRLLRVSADCLVNTLDVIRDIAGRWFLVADHDASFAYGVIEYRSHMLIPLNKNVSWARETTTLDPLTKREKAAGKVDLGQIWVLIERVNREQADGTMRVKEETVTCFSSAELKLGDIVDNMVVKRVNIVRGVYLSELQ